MPMSRACTMAADRAERSASSEPSWMNSSRSFCRSFSEKLAERLEDLERDGPLPDGVHRAVHRGEAALADEGLDDVLVGDGAPDELQRVVPWQRGLPPGQRDDTRGDTYEAKPWFQALDTAGLGGLVPASAVPLDGVLPR